MPLDPQKSINYTSYISQFTNGQSQQIASSIHPPKLVEGPSDEGLRERTGEVKYPLPQYSIYALPDQIRRGEQPRLQMVRKGINET